MAASDIGFHGTLMGYNAPMDSCGHILGRAVTGGGGDLPSSLVLSVSRTTNRLGGAGYYHDVLGNLVTMPAADGVGTVSMTYLDQGHIGTLTDSSGVVWKYYYDADGKRRIKVKTAGGAATEPDGQGGVRLVADRSLYFYEGEDLICQQDVGALVQDESQYEPKFLLLDHLGSTRAELVFTESGGVFSPVIQEYYDLMPYGEVIDPPSTQESVLFTGKQRDFESDLDSFGARYLSSRLGRWSSPDEPMNDHQIKDPQSWCLFSYTRNNPLTRVDPDGRLTIIVPGTWNRHEAFEQSDLKVQVEKTFGEQATVLNNNGMDNTDEARKAAAEDIKNIINNHDFKEGETLNIVAHSHGGNAAFLASNMDIKHKIDNLVTLGTPIRDDYKKNDTMIGKHINVYSEHDQVQQLGGQIKQMPGPMGSSFNQFIPGGRIASNATNVNATALTPNASMDSHTKLWSNSKIWHQLVRPLLLKK